jgi:glutamate racemase
MIGFYDSGCGGLVILREFLKKCPDVEFQYFADLAYLPLGSKKTHEIQDRVKQVCEFLFKKGCDLIVLACNTASVSSIRHLQQVWLPENHPEKQILSITKPIFELMTRDFTDFKSKNGIILCTPATHVTGFYQYEFQKLGFKKLESAPCPDLAKAIENSDKKVIQAEINKISTNLKTDTLDSYRFIVLACTHYSLAKKDIQKIYTKATIIDPATEIAEKLKDYLTKHPKFRFRGSGSKLWQSSPDGDFREWTSSDLLSEFN